MSICDASASPPSASGSVPKSPCSGSLRIKDARLVRIPPRNRPHYPPAGRLAILALRAARGWNTSQTAARFLVE